MQLKVKKTTNRRLWLKRVSTVSAGLLLVPFNKLSATTLAVVSGFATEPFLQNASSGSITVSWATTQNCFSWVEYGASESNLSGKMIPKQDGQAIANRTVNHVQLKRLFPNRTYYYRVVSKVIIKVAAYNKQYGVELKSTVYSFVMPDLTSPSVQAVFIHDTASYTSHLNKLNSPIQSANFVCLNGNVVQTMDAETDLITQVLQPSAEAFAHKKPLVYTRGIKELSGGFSDSFYSLINTSTQEAYFSLLWGPVFFIFLDSGGLKKDDDIAYNGMAFFDDYREEQKIWLEEQLQSADAVQAKYKVVVMSFPTHYGTDEHGMAHVSQLFAPLFNQYGVNALICGYLNEGKVYLPKPSKGYTYAIINGSNSTTSKQSYLQLEADATRLYIALKDTTGQVITYYDTLTSSTPTPPTPSFSYFTQQGMLFITGVSASEISIYDLQGNICRHHTSQAGTLTQIAGLQPGNVYLLKVGDVVKKIAL